jgi:hypothetical protein
MEFSTMTIEQLEARRAAIVTEMDADGADLDALEKEARGIKEELEKRVAAEQQRANIRNAVAAGAGTVITSAPQAEPHHTTLDEVRGSKEYEEAYKKMFVVGVYQKRVTTLEGLALFTSNILLPLLVLLFSNSIIIEVTNCAVLWVIVTVLYGVETLFQIIIIRYVWKGSE